jgi:tRNA threonylcarbamoyladenosine biosynthesis protein TsaB
LGKTPSDIGLVALSIGPGSFTGLRIGVTFAKVFCYSSGAALVALDTLEVIASQANARGSGAASGRIHAILDAGRGELFCASFDGDAEGKLACYSPTEIVSRVDFLARLQPEDAVTGPAVGALRAGLPDTLQVIDETCWSPHATTVAQLGYRYYQQGQRDDIWKLLPKYYRKSYAEEKR